MAVTDVSTGKSQFGLLVEATRSDTAASYVDYDEIDDLLKGVSYISTVGKDITKFDNFEAIFLTHGGLRIVALNASKGETRILVQVGRFSPVSTVLTLENLQAFKSLVQKAKDEIDRNR